MKNKLWPVRPSVAFVVIFPGQNLAGNIRSYFCGLPFSLVGNFSSPKIFTDKDFESSLESMSLVRADWLKMRHSRNASLTRPITNEIISELLELVVFGMFKNSEFKLNYTQGFYIF